MKDILDKLDNIINEGMLGDMAHACEADHEVQMARADLYKIAKYAIKLHDIMKSVSEIQGIQGWQQAKITKAADYLSSVYHNMDYEMSPLNQPEVEPDEAMQRMAFDLASESKETVKESRMSYSDAEKLGSAGASKIDNVLRRKIYDMGKDIRDIEPGTLDRMRYQVAKELGLVESIEIDEGSKTFGSARKKAEASRQRAIEKAKRWMKSTGKSAEDAVKEFDLFPSDIRKLKEEAGYTDEERKAMDDLVNSLGALGGHRDMKKPRYDPDMVKKPGYDPDIIVQQPRYDPDMVKKPGYDPRVYDPGMERDRTQGLDQDFSKRVQQQNQKNMKLNNSKFSDWGKK